MKSVCMPFKRIHCPYEWFQHNLFLVPSDCWWIWITLLHSGLHHQSGRWGKTHFSYFAGLILRIVFKIERKNRFVCKNIAGWTFIFSSPSKENFEIFVFSKTIQNNNEFLLWHLKIIWSTFQVHHLCHPWVIWINSLI